MAFNPRMVVSTAHALSASPLGFSAKPVMRPVASICEKNHEHMEPKHIHALTANLHQPEVGGARVVHGNSRHGNVRLAKSY